ncbi:NADPH oxidase regulator NoxR [Gymnopilus junonius]|uniref:NADPH oxidase regulator NoxR n=1 Tax=Gymnopilus junonius TaxID=109634 RepID=A0A9P5NII4_GYMJU|nr:NADPH oxidase regulator NoxR [Gymnopilus junonius]
MSLKAELETWAAALKAYDEEDFEKALELFSRIADSSKILTNMGLIYATLGEHEAAVERFIEATNLDQYLAVAYFQCGVSNFLLARYELATKDFEEALLYLRGNQAINYEQLGLKFRLFSAEVLFNKGLSQIYMGRPQEGLADMEDARKDKATDEHNVIDDAIQDRGEGYTVFSIPVGVLYRPSEKKLKNSGQRDYMGKAKLVAASDSTDIVTEFSGVARLKAGVSPSGLYLDRPDLAESPSASGTNLLRSATVPPVMPAMKPAEGPRSAGIERSKTMGANVAPTAARETREAREGGNAKAASPKEAGPGAGISRSNTQITPARPSPNAMIGGPVRGLSVRRPGVNAPPAAGPAVPGKRMKIILKSNSNGRLTEFYDDYIEAYGEDNAAPPVPPAPGAGPDRVGAWARNNANPNYQPMARSGSRSAPGSQYAPSAYGGTGSIRRRGTRRTNPRISSRVQSTYEEEEEGYVSGEYDDGVYELSLIRVKVHYQDDIRGMTLTPDVPFPEFMDKVTAKFGKSINGLGLKFQDEDGGKITLRDDSDYELAIETARENAKGKAEGKLVIWCIDI